MRLPGPWRKAAGVIAPRRSDDAMRIGEQLLLALSRNTASVDERETLKEESAEADPLERVEAVFPTLRQRVRGRAVMDFGCGQGLQAIALARAGAGQVVGVDIDRDLLARAEAGARDAGVRDRVDFVTAPEPEHRGRFDFVLSRNSMEHFVQPHATLRAMREALRPGGRLLIDFAPPWLAPYGSHMHFFTPVPWVNVLFSEPTVMAVRARYRTDGATRYEEVKGGLNRMTLRKFESLVRQLGLEVWRMDFHGIKRLDALTRIPGLRELVTNRVSCELGPPASRHPEREPS